MYKIVRVQEVQRGINLVTGKFDSLYTLDKAISDYTKYKLKEDEFLLNIEYFKDNEPYSTYPTLAYLHIAKLIKE